MPYHGLASSLSGKRRCGGSVRFDATTNLRSEKNLGVLHKDRTHNPHRNFKKVLPQRAFG